MPNNRIKFKRKSGPLLRPRKCETSYFYENTQEISAKIESDSLRILDLKDLGPWQRMLYTPEQFKSFKTEDISVYTCLPHFTPNEKSQDSSLIDMLEHEFEHIDNTIIDTARSIMVQFSPNYRALDILLKNTLNWVSDQCSGPSTETTVQSMVNSLLKFEHELPLVPGEPMHEKQCKVISECRPKRNAVLDAAHDFLEKSKLEPYVPCMCNKLFKETLKWVLSKYTGPCKYTLEKIMIKMLLKFDNELNQNIKKPDSLQIEEIKNHNPIVATANTMLNIMTYANDSTFTMLTETLNWVLNADVKDTKKTITALINLEADLEQALNCSA